jgi:hypothetical protein
MALLPYAGLQSYRGAAADVGVDETAISHRDALVEFVAVANWTDPAEDRARMSAARRYAGTVEPFAGGIYVNDLADEGEAGIRRAYGPGQAGQVTSTARAPGRHVGGLVVHAGERADLLQRVERAGQRGWFGCSSSDLCTPQPPGLPALAVVVEMGRSAGLHIARTPTAIGARYMVC